jgi:hypothetical protein
MKNGQAMARPLIVHKGRSGRYFVAVGSGTGLSESVCR